MTEIRKKYEENAPFAGKKSFEELLLHVSQTLKKVSSMKEASVVMTGLQQRTAQSFVARQQTMAERALEVDFDEIQFDYDFQLQELEQKVDSRASPMHRAVSRLTREPTRLRSMVTEGSRIGLREVEKEDEEEAEAGDLVNELEASPKFALNLEYAEQAEWQPGGKRKSLATEESPKKVKKQKTVGLESMPSNRLREAKTPKAENREEREQDCMTDPIMEELLESDPMFERVKPPEEIERAGPYLWGGIEDASSMLKTLRVKSKKLSSASIAPVSKRSLKYMAFKNMDDIELDASNQPEN